MLILFLAGLYCSVTSLSTVREKRQESCTGEGKFLCRNGRCIDEINICDGFDDCWEEIFEAPETRTNISSDETIALCINRKCPKFAFQCSYGGCIDKVKKCDGVNDCNDKSDEDEELCREPIDVRNSFGSNSINPDGTCEVINSPNLILNCTIAGFPVNCSIPATKGTVMKVRCKHGFHKNHFNDFQIESECLENGYWSPKPYDDCTACGRRYALGNYVPLISYGKVAKYLEYPWHTGMYNLAGSDEAVYLCGGSIIHPRAILTAAHCVFDEATKTVNNLDYWIAVGKYNSSWLHQDLLEQRYKVKKVHIRSYYNGLRGRYAQDIAILELGEDINFHTAVSAVCIDWEKTFHPTSNDYGTVVGWGTTENGTISELLRVAKLQFYEFRTCWNTAVEGLQEFLTPDKICAGLRNDTIVQTGDSGGGLTFPRLSPEKKEEHYIYGVVSLKDQSSNELAAFTKVSDYLLWIEEILVLIINESKTSYKTFLKNAGVN